jgi:hypothetical protein
MPRDEELADEDTMNRTLIVLSIRGAHEELARGNPCQIRPTRHLSAPV